MRNVLRSKSKNKNNSSPDSWNVDSMQAVAMAAPGGGRSTRLPTAVTDKVRKGWFFDHFRGIPNTHVIRFKKGLVEESGDALTFRFRKINTAVVEVPTNDRELQIMFMGRSSDFQETNVQGVVTYRITDPDKAAERLDFSLDLDTGTYRVNPQIQLESTMTQIAQEASWNYLSRAGLDQILDAGPSALRDIIATAFSNSENLSSLGLTISQVTITAVRPRADVEKALQVPTFERLQEQADVATYDRRAKAVEKERSISIAEADSQLESSKRMAQLLDQQGANSRKEATDNAEVTQINAQSTNDSIVSRAEAQAKATLVQGEAAAAAEEARQKVYSELTDTARRDLVLRELAQSLGNIENLTITPDLLSKVLAGMANDGTPAN